MAKAMAEGAKEVDGVNVKLTRVAETLPVEILAKLGAVEAAKQWEDVPVVTHDDLKWADAIIWGSPTRFGNVSAQVKAFIDSCGQLWFTGALVGKLAGAFTSSGSQHGGQETTITCGFQPFFFHQGMVVVGLPYSFQGMTGMAAPEGCSPYGASCVTGPKGERAPSETELAGARFQGKHIAGLASRLVKGSQ